MNLLKNFCALRKGVVFRGVNFRPIQNRSRLYGEVFQEHLATVFSLSWSGGRAIPSAWLAIR
jgi:hypothetical protein